MMSDRDWMLSISEAIGSIKQGQEDLNKKIDAYIERSESRLDNLEHIVFRSNGQPSLVDEIRSIKRGWGAAYTVALLLLNGLATYGIQLWIK